MAAEFQIIECPSCGAAVRPGASFCFKCGKHFELAGAQQAADAGIDHEVVPEPVSVLPQQEAGVVERDFNETIPDSAANTVLSPSNDEVEEFNVIMPAAAVRAKPELTSAAALRRKPKLQREKIEMVWEQPLDSSNPVFVTGALAIFALVILIVILVYVFK
jgi:hypothetical protein